MNPTTLLACQKHLFSLPENLVYLNGAYMSPLLKAVEQAGVEGIAKKRIPTSITANDFFEHGEQLRTSVAQLLNVSESQRIVLIPSASYGLSTVAKNISLQENEEVIVADEQFPSNIYVWKRMIEENNGKLNIIAAPQSEENRGKVWNEKILEAINPKTKIVSLSHVHWADGTLFDLETIRQRTREVDAFLILDGTQSIGAYPFDVEKIQPDALIFAGYKWMMGPYGIGFAYFSERFDNGIPLEENWINRHNSQDFTQLVNYQDQYQPYALRYEVGEHSNPILIPMLQTAVNHLLEWGVENIQEYCKAISETAIETLQNKGFWVEDAAYRSNHLFGVRVPQNFDKQKLMEKLQENKVSVSVRGNAIRVSPHLYNTEEDFEKLVGCFN